MHSIEWWRLRSNSVDLSRRSKRTTGQRRMILRRKSFHTCKCSTKAELATRAFVHLVSMRLRENCKAPTHLLANRKILIAPPLIFVRLVQGKFASPLAVFFAFAGSFLHFGAKLSARVLTFCAELSENKFSSLRPPGGEEDG